jgi:hypothetical protein
MKKIKIYFKENLTVTGEYNDATWKELCTCLQNKTFFGFANNKYPYGYQCFNTENIIIVEIIEE